MTQEIEKAPKYFDYNAVADKQLRAALRKKAGDGKAILKRTAQGIWEMGKLLSESRPLINYGQFSAWIEAEFGLERTSAHRFISVFESFPDLPQLLQNATFDPGASVLYLLSAPSVDEESREAAVELIKAGEIKTTADAKAHIEAHKPGQNGTAPAAEYFEEDEAEEAIDEPEEDGLSAADISEAYTVPAVPQSKTQPQATETAPVTQAAIPDDDLTDEEYLLRCPAYRRLMQFPHKGREFKTNALAYRAMSESAPGKPTLLGQVKHSLSRSFETAATGPFYSLAVRFANSKPPQDWPLCVKCQGKLIVFADTGDHTGHGPEINCKGCTGGYTL